MENEELKLAYEKVMKDLKEAEINGQDTTEILKSQINLLKAGYKKLSELTEDEKFDTNPKKYSSLLAYLNNIEKVLIKLNEPTDEIIAERQKIEDKMQDVGLGWLFSNTKK